jgi:hypothetical protein
MALRKAKHDIPGAPERVLFWRAARLLEKHIGKELPTVPAAKQQQASLNRGRSEDVAARACCRPLLIVA